MLLYPFAPSRNIRIACRHLSRARAQRPLFSSQIPDPACHPVQSKIYAALLHSRRVSRRSSGRFPFRPARRTEGRPVFSRPRTLAPPARLRPRRPHEDRARHRPHSLRRPSRHHHRLADLPPARKSRLEELAGIPARSPRAIPPSTSASPLPVPATPISPEP